MLAAGGEFDFPVDETKQKGGEHVCGGRVNTSSMEVVHDLTGTSIQRCFCDVSYDFIVLQRG